jgi:hypothetical protein
LDAFGRGVLGRGDAETRAASGPVATRPIRVSRGPFGRSARIDALDIVTLSSGCAILGGEMSRARRGPDDRGVAALETALILSFVLVPLVFASFDFGRAFWAKTQLTNAAREGGSFAQFYPKLVGPAAASGCNGQDTVFLHASRELSDPSGNITVPGSTVGSTLKIRVPGAAGTPAYTVKVFQRTGSAPGYTWTPMAGCDAASTLPTGTIVRVEVSADIAVVTPVVSQIVGSSIHVTGRQDVRVQ